MNVLGCVCQYRPAICITASIIIRADCRYREWRKKRPARSESFIVAVNAWGFHVIASLCPLLWKENWLCLISGPVQTAPPSSNHRRPRKQIARQQQTQSLRYKAEDLNCAFLNWTENFRRRSVYSVKKSPLPETTSPFYTRTHTDSFLTSVSVLSTIYKTCFDVVYKNYTKVIPSPDRASKSLVLFSVAAILL